MRRKILIGILFICTVILFLSGTVSIACAGDWPMLNHNSRHTGYTEEKISDNLKLLWGYEVDSAVSSPIVADGKVFFGLHNGKIYCLDENNGELIWGYNTGNKVFSSPAVSDGKVFVSATNKFYCLNIETGKVIWSNKISESSPTVANGKVFIVSDGKTYCLDEYTGDVIWSYETGTNLDYDYSPVVANGKVFASSINGKVEIFCLNESIGELIWNYKTDGYPQRSSLAVKDGKVFVGLMDGRVYCLNETTGALIWEYETGGYIDYSPAIADGKVFVNAGKIYCLDENTGDLIWTGTLMADSPLAIANDKVFAVSASYIYCLKENTGEVIWKYECQGGNAVIANGKVFLGSSICNETGYFNDGVYCFGSKGIFPWGEEAPSEEKPEVPKEEKEKEKGIHGFEVLFAIVGLIAVAYIWWRNKK